MWRSFQNLKDVGVVQVKVIRAEGLMAADVTGKTAAVRPGGGVVGGGLPTTPKTGKESGTSLWEG